MGYEEQVSETFYASVDLKLEEAVERARTAIESIGSVGTWRPRITQNAKNGFVVTIKATLSAALADPTKFMVAVKQEGNETIVRAKVTDYSVYQEKLLGLIPIGPKRVNGMRAYARCLEQLRQTFD